MSQQKPLEIRPAQESDARVLLSFIRKLADYERLSHEMVAEEEDVRRWLFGPNPVAEAALAYSNGRPVGYVVFFTIFSTFAGSPAIYLEDLFVDGEHRGKGTGHALLSYVAKLAMQRNYGAVVWAVLEWNQPAIHFYRSLGATPEDDWRIYKISGEPLKRLSDRLTSLNEPGI
ncbi:MAG: GNAT family N-acetyltransferase [Acidobacteriaceae bacterium]|nr:GNAT family N-acetyltransferase [Acidobacteriaceae bacterium]MBV8571809.1 GNAT family N-acetyltransferase [Acidobacteriaceae bacterium]